MADPDALAPPLEQISTLPPRPRRRWVRAVLWTLATILLLVVVLGVAFVLWLRSATRAALPQLDGDLRVAGLSAPVTVRRDGHGVPHIDAATQDDLFFAQGYVVAQDRLWQMDMYRRNANGELAEVLGSSRVPHDRAQRVLGFRKAAEHMYAGLDAQDRRWVDDYARGVNAFIEQHRDNLPEEFRLLMYKPRPWTGVDSMSIGTMMIDMLDTHWDAKLAREEIAARLNNPRLEAELYPVGSWRDRPPTGEVIDLTQPEVNPPPVTDEEDDDNTTAGTKGPRDQGTGSAGNREQGTGDREVDVAALRATLGLPDCTGCASGSNNWVIAGKHTASGKPLLANDMHLVLTEPNIWYMADLRAPGYHAAGVALPGLPWIIAGHNEHVAWGFTALFADVQDLYHERLDGKGNYQAADGSWKPLRMDRETIRVRGGKDVTVDVQSTEHGPLLNPMFAKPLNQPVALKWTLYDASVNGLPLYAMNTAQNWAEFSSALGKWCWPTQNVVYADDQGHIAYHAVGKVPLRPGGLQGEPVAAGDAGHEWQGTIPFDGMPNAFDPPSGFLATANARVTTEKSPYPLALEWIDPYRVERIYKLLLGRDGLTAKDMIAVQTDIYSEVDQELAHRFAYAIDHASKTDDRLRKAADLMRSWDGKLTLDSAAASLVDEARHALWPLILDPKLGDATNDYRWAEEDFAEEEIIMHDSTEWLPLGYKTWDDVLTEAVRRGMAKGKAPHDVSKWAYGSWHGMDIEHPLAGMLPILGRKAGLGRQPMSGDTTTVKQISLTLAPSQRFTMDWSNVDGSTENIVLGESSDPYSAYFRDQWDYWYGGTTFPLPFSAEAVAANTRHTLRLLP
ncbi:MAG TPA: penicillin acylase family protein [Terracidiphilus sp.]|jgi:penicillin amidase|nr:penicillin acylase family protein [Terracidiphilus sp.]